jgi:hypothetical protein
LKTKLELALKGCTMKSMNRLLVLPGDFAALTVLVAESGARRGRNRHQSRQCRAAADRDYRFRLRTMRHGAQISAVSRPI